MIVSMKKAHLVVLKEDQEQLLKSLQKHSVLMLIKTGDNIDHHAIDSQFLGRIEKSITHLKKYNDKSKKLVIDYEDFVEEDPKRQSFLEEIEKTNEEILRLKTYNENIQEEVKLLQPWLELDMKISEMSAPRLAKLHIGFMETRKMPDFINKVESFGGKVISFSQNKHLQAILYAAYYQDDEELLNEVKNLGFDEQFLPSSDAYVRELLSEKAALIDKNNSTIAELEENLISLAENIEELRLLNDQITSRNELEVAAAGSKTTLTTCYIEGWVRTDEHERLIQAIKETTDIYDLELTDPNDDDKPPTVTKNNKFTDSFEIITDMFSKPDPREVDPNPIMSIWYWILFGIMMGDTGYGLVMMIVSYLVIKFKKPKGGMLRIIKIFFYSGITTIIWGILFGSYFGLSWDPVQQIGALIGRPEWKSVVLQPIDQPLEMLALSIIIGALHIISGIIMKAVRNFVDKQYFAIFADQVSWIMILVGIGLLALPATSKIGIPMVIFGAAIVVLTGGRHKKGIFGKVTSGVLSLYDIANYMSDILSYSRILALALSTAIIGMVMNMIAGMILGVPVIGIVLAGIVFVVGHVFNIAMGLLSAYVHDSRLQYVEFFGKFYDGGGYEFKPLSLKLKYVDQVSKNN